MATIEEPDPAQETPGGVKWVEAERACSAIASGAEAAAAVFDLTQHDSLALLARLSGLSLHAIAAWLSLRVK
jgi:hypothetical protein